VEGSIITVDAISSELRTRFGVNDFFYPKISMEIDVPGGLEGEITKIVDLLKRNGYAVTASNVFHVMTLKKQLLLRYKASKENELVLEDYDRLLLEKIKPIGISIPIDLVFVTGLTSLLIYLAARFGGSFMDEAGRIVARKLLEEKDGKKTSKDLNLVIDEYNFLKNQVIILISDNKIVEVTEKLKKNKK
jgi:hypothetical protein